MALRLLVFAAVSSAGKALTQALLATCDTYTCPDSHFTKPDPSTHTCEGPVCDTATCCDPKASRRLAIEAAVIPNRPPDFCKWEAVVMGRLIDSEGPWFNSWQTAVDACNHDDACYAISQDTHMPRRGFQTHGNPTLQFQVQSDFYTWTCEGDCVTGSVLHNFDASCYPTCEMYLPHNCESGILKRDPALGICYGGGTCDVASDAEECCGVLGVDDVDPNGEYRDFDYGDGEGLGGVLGVVGAIIPAVAVCFLICCFGIFVGLFYTVWRGKDKKIAGLLNGKYHKGSSSSSSDSDSDTRKKKKKNKKEKKEKKMQPDDLEVPIAIAVPVEERVNARSRLCRACGARNEEDVAFCHNCGKQMT